MFNFPTSDIEKSFVFENDTNHKQLTLNWHFPMVHSYLTLQPVINYFISTFPSKSGYCFKIFNPQVNGFDLLLPPYIFSNSYLLLPQIVIRYRECIEQQSYQDVQQYTPKSIKEVDNQRSIRQVIKSVKQWRRLHSGTLQNPQKLTLQQAAKKVGISKKCLDDYFSLLKLGQKHGFDFASQIDENIYVLRAFIKKHKYSTKVTSKNPKNVKFNTQMQCQSMNNFNSGNSQLTFEMLHPVTIMPIELNQQQFQLADTFNTNNIEQEMCKEEQQYQDQFYKCFQLVESEPQDPFVPFVAKDYGSICCTKQDCSCWQYDIMY